MNRSTFLLALCLLWWPAALPAQTSLSFWGTDLNEAREIAGQKGLLYFAYFAADWCVPCQWMEKATFRNSRLNAYIKDNYQAVKIDVDKRSSRPIQEQYKVSILPSILVFSAQGQLLTRIETALSGQDLLEILQEYDQPGNRIAGQISTVASAGPLLDSPKPSIRVYRPPLQTEATESAAETPLPPPVMINGPTAAMTRTKVPVYAHGNETLAPRSEHSYRIQIGVYDRYQDAVRKVGQLEESFQEPVQLLAAKGQTGRQSYRIFIGQFSQKKAAEEFLYYLRRKNLDGQIVDGVR